MNRGDLSEEEWERLKPLLPPQKARTGRPALEHRRLLNGILWVLRTGAPWRDLPERYGPWQTVATRFYRWRKAGFFDRLLAEVQSIADEAGKVNWEVHFVDATIVRLILVPATMRLLGRWNWWATRWIEAMERLVDGRRLSRGRNYARRGQVLSIEETGGGIDARVQFHITGNQPGDWIATIRDQKLAVEPGTTENPNLRFSADAQDVMNLFNGKLNPMQAYMQGKVQFQGDMGLAMRLAGLFDRKD